LIIEEEEQAIQPELKLKVKKLRIVKPKHLIILESDEEFV